VSEDHCRPVGGLVTGIALQAGSEVVPGLAGGLYAVMAGRTGARDAVMIEAGRYPGSSGVALIALGRRLNVLRVLAGGGAAVVTA